LDVSLLCIGKAETSLLWTLINQIQKYRNIFGFDSEYIAIFLDLDVFG
jgi:hypothetical protein